MGLNVGLSGATAVCVGASSSTGVYLGSTEVYSGGSADYSSMYFTIEVVSGTAIWFENHSYSGTPLSIDYSINGGEWQTLSEVAGSDVVMVSNGDKVRFRGNNEKYASGAGKYYCFDGDSGEGENWKVYGNIMSLINGDSFVNTDIPAGGSRQFAYLFKDNASVIDASNLVLPASTRSNIYQATFSGCVNLEVAPALSGITTLSQAPFNSMFSGCTSLTTAPDLTFDGTLPTSAYRNMFDGCTGLNYVKCLATDVTTNATTTQYWLRNVSPTGTFVKNASMLDWPSGADGIPSGWTVEDAS